jgi:hypothetical protein
VQAEVFESVLSMLKRMAPDGPTRPVRRSLAEAVDLCAHGGQEWRQIMEQDLGPFEESPKRLPVPVDDLVSPLRSRMQNLGVA